MPSPFTSSFASAAASNAGESNTRNTGSGDWSRTRINGSTTTFRRPSGANNSLQRSESGANSTNHIAGGSVYIPPHMASNHISSSGRNGSLTDTRYSKEQLLEFFRAQQDGDNQPNLEDFFVDGWNPRAANNTTTSGWGRVDDRKESQGTDICWDFEGTVQPLGLMPMSDEEKELFSTTVNSPIKPPTQNKDGTPNTPGLNRRTSLSQSQGTASSTRPGGRQRRDSSDLLGNSITSPTGSRFSKEDSSVSSPPPSLLRRKTDFKDNFGPKIEERESDVNRPTIDTSSPIGTLKRTATNPLNASLNGPSSPWSTGPASAGFAPMGAFGNFGAPPSAADRKPGFGRSESRFKSLMGGQSTEDVKKSSNQNQRRASGTADDSLRSPWESGTIQRKELGDLYEDEPQPPAGSAALGGEDASPPTLQPSRSRHFDTQPSIDDIGFSSIGIGPNSDLQDLAHRSRNYPPQQSSQQGQYAGPLAEPLSPTFTNPYQSPEGEKAIPRDIDADDDHIPYPQGVPFARGFPNQPDQTADRSQTSSAGASRGFSGISGLGGLSSLGLSSGGPWSAAPGAVGTPSRAFGDSPFGQFNDAGPQNMASLGSSGFFGASGPAGGNNAANAGRGSRLVSFLPGGMQDSRQDPQRVDSGAHDLDSSAKANRARLDDILTGVGQEDRFRGPLTSTQGPPSAPLQAPFSATVKPSNYFNNAQDQDQGANQLPASQQRQMVMPDRMRWIYRDPQGNQQGPWSGLEMHDWYKAGFFSPELQVKKLEDADYEPLAQLIRRIGNSREPFLVPQIGIPHGDPPSAGPSTGQTAAQPGGSSSAQPPFASSFPSFGTTLTAEQQNALERRKQEEQYLMARQKEHLAAMQPAMQRQMQQHIHNQQLNHHSSAQSLQSQPSYGSITSPGGYQAQPSTGPIQPPSGQNFYEGMARNAGPEAIGQRDENLPGLMERMNLTRGSMPYGNAGAGQDAYHQQQVDAIMQEKARLQREQQRYDTVQRGDDDRASVERFEEFQRLRAQEPEQRRFQQPPQGAIGDQVEQFQSEGRLNDDQSREQLSLSEQVQKTQSEATMPQPFPPAQSSSPMPAPTPQRNRQSVAEALNAESHSQSPSQPDSAETPSATLAPWAKEANEVSKGPSLKEIQANEARKAAQQEEVAAAARRAAAEHERVAQHTQAIPPAPGLPSSANWASSVSPAVPAPSPWTKPVVGKPTVATPTAGQKKTLAQIQKEEEARKTKAAVAAAAVTTVNPTSGAGGKRYADLASKTTSAAPSNPNNAAWTTVGAGGKVKAPTLPISRSASGNIPTTSSKPKAPATAAPKTNSSHHAAYDDFQKWVRNALGKGLNTGIPVDDFISSLMSLPLEADIISDSIYASSQTLDGRRFAEDFVKRRKQADRGVSVDPATGSYSSATPSDAKSSGNGGWSEVAKKGSQGASSAQAEKASEFKVVAGKKKGKR